MGKIILQFCAFDSLAGHIVTNGTQGTVGHVSLVLPSGGLIDAQDEDGLGGKPSGVQIRAASYIKESGGYNVQRATLPTTDETAQEFYTWALSMEGSLYDLKADFGIALNSDWHTEGKLICSGFAMCALTMPKPAFITSKLVKNPHIWSPEEVMLMCNAFCDIIPMEG